LECESQGTQEFEHRLDTDTADLSLRSYCLSRGIPALRCEATTLTTFHTASDQYTAIPLASPILLAIEQAQALQWRLRQVLL
jgi:hypothetical protein